MKWKTNERHRRRIGHIHITCILAPQNEVWKRRYWDSPQWKVGAIHSHKLTHVMHTLLIRPRTLRMRYSYAHIRYSYAHMRYVYVTHTRVYTTHTVMSATMTNRRR